MSTNLPSVAPGDPSWNEPDAAHAPSSRGSEPENSADPSSFGAGVSTRPAASASGTSDGAATPRKKRSRRGGAGRSRKKASAGAEAEKEGAEASVESSTKSSTETSAETSAEAPKTTRRRRGGRGRGRKATAGSTADAAAEAPAPPDREDESAPTVDAAEAEDAPARTAKAGTRRRGGRRRRATADDSAASAPTEAPETETGDDEAPAAGRRRRRKRGSRGGRKRSAAAPVEVDHLPGEDDDFPAPDAERERSDEEDAPAGGRSRRKSRARAKPEERGTRKTKAARPAALRSGESRSQRRTRSGESSTRRSTAVSEKPEVPNTILVNASDPEETRVAVVENGVITEFQMTVRKHKTFVNDIYRGRVVNLEPAIGAAFVDFGQGRNGFLHTSDVLSAYGEKDWGLDKILSASVDPDEWESQGSQRAGDFETEGEEGSSDKGAEKSAGKAEAKGGRGPARGRGVRHRARPRLPITDLIGKGQSVCVQITKDAIGDKGPALTTYISIPGRYLVLMPSMDRTGVSRKIEDEKERRRLKRILQGLKVPEGMGVIVRTAGVGHTKADIQRDLDYLLALWEDFAQRLTLGRGPMALYEESDVAIRTMRDLFGSQTDAVWVDDPVVHQRMVEFTKNLMPDMVDRIQLHEGSRPLFHTFGVEQDFERIFTRRIELPSGGSIVFDQTEALVAIDVNSGKTRSDGFNFEEIALKANLEAVPEIALQIRLRDLGGIIVIDFIDMMRASNRRAVEKAMREALSTDRARSKIGRLSQFGLLEMTRQRLGPGLSKMLFKSCPDCRGSGRVRTDASRAEALLRRLASALSLKGFSKVEVRARPEVIEFIERHHGGRLRDLSKHHERELVLMRIPGQAEDSVLRYLRADGREVRPGGRRKR